VIIKEVFSDLFKLSIEMLLINLKKNPLQKKWKFLGGGGEGSTNDPLERKFQGGEGE